jgi:hypothetical protein
MLFRHALALSLLMGSDLPVAAADNGPMAEHPADLQWRGWPGGNQTSLVMGDPTRPGPFVSIINWVSGSISKPHYHPYPRTFVVLKGHWDFGSGPRFDLAAIRPCRREQW